MTRRHFLESLAAVSIATFAGGRILAANQPCVINQRTIALGGLAPAFNGIRVALLSDFHHGPLVPASRIREAVQQTNNLRPDLIALTGDYVHRGREWVAGCFKELAALRAPLGVYGVLGNHDHYKGSEATVRSAMEQASITDLTNHGVELRRDEQTLRLCGVGDLWCEKQKLAAALGPSDSKESAVLLSHNPDYAERLRDERVGLVLSGHTHGGQCVFPFIGAPILPSRYGQKYASGLCRGPVTKVFVTTGVGHSFPPFRINCPPEIALLTLFRSQRV